MLMTAAYILAMDTFGPITDNAGGIVEMSNQPESVRDVTDALDSVGNTTKALTKGYAVGTAALAAFLLFSAFLEEVNRFKGQGNEVARVVNVAEPKVFVGGLIGAMIVFLFTSLAIRAVGNAAGDMIEEVRRQFKADPGIMAGTSLPDYARCVDISVRSALREMVLPGILAVAGPVIVGNPPRLGSRCRSHDDRNDRRCAHGPLPEQWRWCMGQREEVHRSRQSQGRTRQCPRQGFRCPQCRGRR